MDDYLFFVMEYPLALSFSGRRSWISPIDCLSSRYVENGSLNETMKKFGVFPEELVVLYVAQVLQGLKYLHDQNVIHRHVLVLRSILLLDLRSSEGDRDIKGCNLLLTKEGKIKLADFGSCTNAAVDKQYTVVGTPFWSMSAPISNNVRK